MKKNEITPEQKSEALDERIAEVVNSIREIKTEMERCDAELLNLRQELGDLLSQRGTNWADDNGYARLVSEGTRISYDTEALDELIINDPLRYGWLKDYRRESKVSGRVQVQ